MIAAFLSLGALAGAATAILALRPRDAEDSVGVNGIRVISEVPMGDYLQRLERSAPRRLARTIVPPTAGRAPLTTLPSRGTSGSPASKVPITSPRTKTPQTTVTSTSARPIPGEPGERAAQEKVTRRVVADISAGRRGVCSGSEADSCVAAAQSVAAGSRYDSAGALVPTDVAVRRAHDVLADARTDENGEPVGAIVSVDVELSGLRDETVALTWSMWHATGGGRVHGEWLNTTLVHHLRASTDRDTASVDLWVPLPPRPGPYVVRVDFDAGGAHLAGADSTPFG